MALALLKNAVLQNPHGFRKIAGILCNTARNHWNYQYQPGPYPRTPEERAAAAKKYNMSIEEYQPYPEEEGYGDYPKLPDIGADSKDPTYPYDCPELKRNFNEPFHAIAEIIGEDRYDISMRPRFSLSVQWSMLLTAIGGSAAIYLFLENHKVGRPVICKQYPGQGI
ncbi:hypothetical protein ACJJTC_001244 [Scirpophaga incertulas]